MLERFLVPLDSDSVAEHVLPYVSLLAKQLQQPVVLLSVLIDAGHLNPVAHAYDQAIADLFERRKQYAQHYLDGVRERLAGEGVSATTEVTSGDAPDGILEAAAANQAGLIAMATHGRSGPERWFLGSVADKVVRHASVPVLLVRPNDDEPRAGVRQVIVPLDGSRTAEGALPYASFVAKAFAVPVRLVRTIPVQWWSATGGDPYGGMDTLPPEVITTLEDDAKQYLEQTATRLRGDGLTVATSFRLFCAADTEIEQQTAATPGSLVVMTSHGRSGVTRAILGSIAERVVRSSLAPVLVVHPA